MKRGYSKPYENFVYVCNLPSLIKYENLAGFDFLVMSLFYDSMYDLLVLQFFKLCCLSVFCLLLLSF